MTPQQKIDQKIAQLDDWRAQVYTELREIINHADTGLKEDWKWNTAVWSKNGLVCAVGAFKSHVKLNLFRGSELKDPFNLINNGFDSKGHRSVDFREGDKLDREKLTVLVQEAVALNDG